jgi:hypothetical protein
LARLQNGGRRWLNCGGRRTHADIVAGKERFN